MEALKFCWDNFKIKHRDIKPDNILITDDFTIILIDFGFAKEMRSSYVNETDVGSEAYKAPEYKNKNMKITYKIDIWALGLILYFLCTLRHAYTIDLDSCIANI